MGWEVFRVIKFTIPGRPVPAVRMTQKTKWTNPQAQRYIVYKRDAGWFARQATKEMLTGDVEVKVDFYLWGNRRMDLDNLCKSILDSANQICFEDDRQVVSLIARKFNVPRKDMQRAEVEIKEVCESEKQFA